MNSPSEIYEKLRCTKCERRLKQPFELKCNHFICRDCLETVLRNHPTEACCSNCKRPLGEYKIENYTYLPSNHFILRLLSTFTDVNTCETCKNFTTVEKCSECSSEQCPKCYSQHEAKHRSVEEKPKNPVALAKEEIDILESIKKYLTEKEFEDLVETAQKYLDDALLKENKSIFTSAYTGSSSNSEKQSLMIESTIYDWSKHENFTEYDILHSKPERVKQLLRLGFTPRPYQIRMTRPGLEGKNSLICLQTGAGKTYIAAMVAKFFHIQSIQNRKIMSAASSAITRFKAVFLVPIKALVTQQCEAFKNVFIDESDSILKTIDNQAGERFKIFYQQCDIFFFTVQKFANFLKDGCADLSKFDLIIIDECHHCYDNHPISSMMRQYHRLKLAGAKLPKIMGLTASVGTNKKNAFNHLVHLCANLDCLEICAIEKGIEEVELRNSTNTPLSDTILTVPKELSDPITMAAKDDVMKHIAGRLGFDISIMDNQKLENFLVLEHQNACKKNDRDAIIGCDYLNKFHRFVMYYDDLALDECIKWLAEEIDRSIPSNPTTFEQFCRKKSDEFFKFVAIQISCSKPIKAKLEKLVEMIINLHTPNCRGLVLVRTKFHAVSLETFLSKHPDLRTKQINVGYLTGQGSADELSLPGSQQAQVLIEFRKGTKNLLVATDVAQEGLDVAECSYVIRYEFVSNEIGTVQSRGRARALQSKCYLITEASSMNYQREKENRIKEEDMKEAIVEWRQKGIQEFQKLVHNEQNTLSKALSINDFQNNQSTFSQTSKETAKTIHCRYCDTYLCKGSSLRLQGTTVICIDAAFEQLVKPPKTSGDKFVCPNKTCHKELGAVILLSRNIPGYALQISALKFFFDEESLPRLFKKWSLYGGYIEQL